MAVTDDQVAALRGRPELDIVLAQGRVLADALVTANTADD